MAEQAAPPKRRRSALNWYQLTQPHAPSTGSSAAGTSLPFQRVLGSSCKVTFVEDDARSVGEQCAVSSLKMSGAMWPVITRPDTALERPRPAAPDALERPPTRYLTSQET